MDKDEQLKMEHNTLLEEYGALKTEIVSNLESARQIANLCLTAIGVLIAATPFIVQSQATILLLIAPLFFYALAWAQLRYTYLVLDMSAYLRDTVVPGIHRILAELASSEERDFSKIMSWELPGKGPTRLRPTGLHRLLFLPVAGANYGIPLLAAVLSVGAFLILAFQSSQTISSVQLALIVVNVLAFFYSAFWGFRAEFLR